MNVERDTVSIDILVTDWEKDVVMRLSEGKTVPEISSEIKLDARSVEYRLSKLKTKILCKTSAGLVAFFLRNKLID